MLFEDQYADGRHGLMASLASYTTLYVTAIRVDGGVSLKNIAAVRWDAGDGGPGGIVGRRLHRVAGTR